MRPVAQVAQLVEQGIENPRVGGSIPSLGTMNTETTEQPSRVAEVDWLWYNLATPPRLGLAAPVKKLLKRAAQAITAGEPT